MQPAASLADHGVKPARRIVRHGVFVSLTPAGFCVLISVKLISVSAMELCRARRPSAHGRFAAERGASPARMIEAANRGGLDAARGASGTPDYTAYAQMAKALTAVSAAASPIACHVGL